MQIDKKRLFFTIISFIALFIDATPTQAQNDDVLDPSGYVNKYDVDFDGIGPRVYVLPAPRTRAELLTDSFRENRSFQDSIVRALDFQQLVAEHKPTYAERRLPRKISAVPPTAENWNTLVAPELAKADYKAAYAMLHAYATVSLRAGAVQKAIGLLQSALQHAQKTANTADIATIQYNLANLYLYERNIAQADVFQKAYYRTAVQRKNRIEQANSLVKLALIQALKKDYSAAENSIIRKAIPLLNRAKAYEEKIDALQALAKIYRLQNKHTEAQWFLIQARDLATARGFRNEFATIEYMLAFSKFIQKNYNVAKKEFLQANEFAQSEDNKLLQLAIADKLGQIYMTQNDLNNAEAALHSYQDLRKELFGEEESS